MNFTHHIHHEAFIHPTSFIDTPVQIQEGVKIWHFCHVLSHTILGKNSSFGQNCVLGPRVRIGSGVRVQNNVSIFEGVEIEDDVFLGPSVVFSNVMNPRAFINQRGKYQPTILKKGCSLGSGVVVVCGSVIGEYALIGAGTLIKGFIKPHALMVGNPMRQIGWVDKCGMKLTFQGDLAYSQGDKLYYRLQEKDKNQWLEPIEAPSPKTPMESMEIDFSGIKQDFKNNQELFLSAITKVGQNAQFIMGDEVRKLENELRDFIFSPKKIPNETSPTKMEEGICLTCSSGTSALHLALLALGIGRGDEVIVPAFSFFASAEAIAFVGAKPIFSDITFQDFCLHPQYIEELLTPNTKAVMAVSLFGQCPNLIELKKICQKHKIFLIEDGAQSFGAKFSYKNQTYASLSLADISTTSFFPAKPMGALGDGGAIFLKNQQWGEKIKLLRSHGQKNKYEHELIGLNSRLDTLQAAILSIKLKNFSTVLQKRNALANYYQENLKILSPDISTILDANSMQRILHETPLILPHIKKGYSSTFAQFCILVKDRDALMNFLKEKRIPTAIHYPNILPHQKPFFHTNSHKNFPNSLLVCKHILSLPMNIYLKTEELCFITQSIKEFYGI